jgi:predicted nucleic acid-binding protein
MKALTRSRTLLLDTNLLLLLFIGAQGTSLIPKAKTLAAFLEDDYDLLVDVVNNSFNRIVTTPHIMTEVSNLLGKERDDICRLGREAMAELLSKCTEHTDSSATLVAEPEFDRLGLTDVAIAVASKLPAFVLTADLPLYLHVSSSGLDAENFNHIRQGSWS